MPKIQVDLRSGHKIYALVVSRCRSAILCRTVYVCAEDLERIVRTYDDGGDNVAVARQLSIPTEDDGLVNCGPAHSFVYLIGLTLHMRIAEYRTWAYNKR